jgi:acyl-coenzyme A synthetase/AMP-(fatty) acid ligase
MSSRGAASPRYPSVNVPNSGISHFVLENHEVDPGRPALIDGASERVITYAALRDDVRSVAAGLRRLGVGPGGVVAVFGPDSPDYVATAVTAFSADAAAGRYADCARAMGVANAADSTQTAIKKLVDALYRRNQELQLPSPKQYGISEEKYFEVIPVMAAQALASGSPQNNPRIPTADEIAQLYRQVWA